MFRVVLVLILIVSTQMSIAQEWKSLKAYRKETGNDTLAEGHWLKKDRKKNRKTWQEANKYNLVKEDGYLTYKTIDQVRDFYLWFDEARKERGHEVQWFGVTAIVENKISKLDSWFVRTFIVPNKEVQNFAHEGTQKVFEYSFPQMRNLWFSKAPLKGKAAEEWDKKHGHGEQCTILEPLYRKLSPHGFKKLERIAKRKGLYGLAIPKAMEYEGKLDDCHTRVDYAIKKLIPYYNKQKAMIGIGFQIAP